jgi:putative Ca2+/H+ antiporter (TMEM165/GDT1 family)
MSSVRVIATGFGVIFVAEFGDLIEIVTANLAAKHHDPIMVGISAALRCGRPVPSPSTAAAG